MAVAAAVATIHLRLLRGSRRGTAAIRGGYVRSRAGGQ